MDDLKENLKYLNITDLNKIKDILEKEIERIGKDTNEGYSLYCLFKRVEMELEYVEKYGQSMATSAKKIQIEQ